VCGSSRPGLAGAKPRGAKTLKRERTGRNPLFRIPLLRPAAVLDTPRFLEGGHGIKESLQKIPAPFETAGSRTARVTMQGQARIRQAVADCIRLRSSSVLRLAVPSSNVPQTHAGVAENK